MRSVILCMFDKAPSLLREGVEVFHHFYRVLPQYPFPKDFYRPLTYPFVEHHKGDQISLCIFSEYLMKEIEKEQDHPQN